MSSDESVVSTFPVSASMVQPLVTQVCALFDVASVPELLQRLAVEPSLSLYDTLVGAVENPPERLEALAVVGWETNER